MLKTKGGNINSLKVEQILVAMGREANVRGLALEGIGIEPGPKGIQADGRLRTVHKHIYAAGDVTGVHQFTHAAGYEGGIVVANAVFHLPRKADYTLMPRCTYTDPELAGIGMNEKGAGSAGIEYSVFTEHFRDNDRSLAEGEAVGKIKMILDKDEKPMGGSNPGAPGGRIAERMGRPFEREGETLHSGIRRSSLPHPRRNQQAGGGGVSFAENFFSQSEDGSQILF